MIESIKKGDGTMKDEITNKEPIEEVQEVEEPKSKSKSKETSETEKVSDGARKSKVSDKKITEIEDIPGVGAATADKLRTVGFNDLMSIAVATPGELTDATGMTAAAAKKMIAASRTAMDMGFESGDVLLQKRKEVLKLQIGSAAFDELVGGGFESRAITECFGQYGSSKTQIAHQLCINLQLTDSAGPEPIAVYIDTEGTFRPERIIEMAKGANLDPEMVLKRIKVARAFNSDHQMLLAEKVGELVEQGLNVKLVIVDSLTSHFRAEYVGRGTLADRQQKLNKHMHMLSKVGNKHNIIVYVTNQVMAKPDQFFGDPTESIGGHIVAHNSTFRIYLRRGKKGSRVAKLIDSPNLPDGEAPFIVLGEGIRDLK